MSRDDGEETPRALYHDAEVSDCRRSGAVVRAIFPGALLLLRARAVQ